MNAKIALTTLALAAVLLAAAIPAVPAEDGAADHSETAKTDEEDTQSKDTEAEDTRDDNTAEKDTEDRETFRGWKSGDTVSPLADLGTWIATILIVVVLGVAAWIVVKKVLPRMGVAKGRRIDVLENVYLGPKKTLHLVHIGDRTLLIGATSERLDLLADVTGSVAAEGPASAPARTFEVPGAPGRSEKEGPGS